MHFGTFFRYFFWFFTLVPSCGFFCGPLVPFFTFRFLLLVSPFSVSVWFFPLVSLSFVYFQSLHLASRFFGFLCASLFDLFLLGLPFLFPFYFVVFVSFFGRCHHFLVLQVPFHSSFCCDTKLLLSLLLCVSLPVMHLHVIVIVDYRWLGLCCYKNAYFTCKLDLNASPII